MTDEVPGLMRVGPEHGEWALEVLLEAFRDYPFYVTAIPDRERRYRTMPSLERMVLRYGLRWGEVYASSAWFEGLAIWLPPGATSMTTWRELCCGALGVSLEMGLVDTLRLTRMGAFLDERQRHWCPEAHWYLLKLGVASEYRGLGIGSGLLDPMLDRLDRAGQSAYLETSNQAAIPLYESRGFLVREYREIPGTDLINWCLVRPGADARR